MRRCLAWTTVLAVLWPATEAFQAPGSVVTDSISVSSNISCSGLAGKCFCQPTGPNPKQRYQLSVTLTLPTSTSSGTTPAGPYPVILFLHGFGGKYILHTGDYQEYADAATQAGFAFLEYDITSGGGWMETATDAIELQFLPQILKWAKEVNERPETPAHGRIDSTRLAVSGHSRGGKLAALHFGSGMNKDIFGAYLVDPVDCPCFAPCETNCYPSALDAISAAGRPLGVSGAEVKGCCNPRAKDTCSLSCKAACYGASGNATCTGNDYQDFLYASGGGSIGHTQAAGHMQFATIKSPTLQALANAFCGSDRSVSNEEVSRKAAQHMVDWLTSQLPSATGLPSKHSLHAGKYGIADATTDHVE